MLRRVIIATVLSAVGLFAAVPAQAVAATFTVNETGDEDDANLGNGRCDHDLTTDGRQCTLRAAIQEANIGPGRDTITFVAPAKGGTITPQFNLDLDTPMVIDGGDCGDATIAHKPCVHIDNPPAGVSLSIQGDDVTIRGLAVTGVASFPGIPVRPGANRFKLRNSWLGMDLGQNPDPNSVGVSLEGNDALIGGKRGKDRNVFAYSNDEHLATIGPSFELGNRTKVRGNYFGTKADGTTGAGSPPNAIRVAGEENVIGASISSSKRATPQCDGGCNVIANASTGIFDAGEQTKIKGNFIGLDKTGTTALPNTSNGIDERGMKATIGGGTSAERNFITGGVFGIFKFGATNMSVKRNFIGLDSAGTAIPAGSTLDTAVMLGTDATAARNRIAGCDIGINVDGPGAARVVRNKIGVGKNGEQLAGASNIGILAARANSLIGEPGAGNTIGNSGDGIVIPGGGGSGGDGNKVQGNYIGVDSAGVARPNTGVGVSLTPSGSEAPDDNVIGGGSAAHENVISNSGEDAIRISAGATNPERNLIKRNRGKDNGDPMSTDCDGGPCDLFIDIGPDGFGNLAGPNDQIDAPDLTNDEPGDATRTHLEGTARENATIYIFRTSAAADLSPNRINAFVKQVSVGGGNEWSANFSQIPSGQRLTALQIDPNGNASELALAVDPVVAP